MILLIGHACLRVASVCRLWVCQTGRILNSGRSVAKDAANLQINPVPEWDSFAY